MTITGSGADSRPLLAARLETVEAVPPEPWHYDEARQMSVDANGRAVVLTAMSGLETFTEANSDPSDAGADSISALETITKADSDPGDADIQGVAGRIHLETDTRAGPDSDESGIFGSRGSSEYLASMSSHWEDDLATGLVGF